MAESLKNNMVGLFRYTLRVDGAIMEEVPADDAVEYLHGAENIVPGLEKALEGKSAGDSFTATISPEDAYGEYDDEQVQEILREDIESDEEFEPGQMIDFFDEDGETYEAVVIEVNDDNIVVDFNHELAGKTLQYDVTVVSVREATEEEVENGLPASLMETIADMFDEAFYGENGFEDEYDD